VASYANPRYRQSAVEAPAPLAQSEPESPVEQAAQAEISKRLQEQQRAEQIAQQAPRQDDPALATEPQQEQPQLPANVREWLSEHPQFMRDRKQNLRLQLAHEEAAEAGIDVGHADYLAALEQRLGLRVPPPAPSPVQHHDDPRDGMGYSSAAPVSREAPSMSSGRRFSSESQKLTSEEAAMARGLGLSETEYRVQKEKMLRLKASGALQT
jgi:hypothetical protein